MPNNRLKLTAPAVHASCDGSWGKGAPFGPQLNRSISGKEGNEQKVTISSWPAPGATCFF